ncbi:hypothetical protein [Cohaesibacter celericrescens]|uniref:Uncharacterized protein n=1 Tax=Cohaesibacter celericrescens TaxID=2067669 RepID=A0A2N5XKW0_9HYPH|nr:hypothetical protein [Cohaesibacter celericrescens]PLW75067.1 hypothetical protein C0081_22490 [Cohaesibacter celericrescens]
MSETSSLPDASVLLAANINPSTLLATDYLNHFNEVLMLIEILPAMPECADDVFSWRPMTYADYFKQSTFKEKNLAISLYESIPDALKSRFESLIHDADEKIFGLIERISSLDGDLSGGSFENLAFMASTEIRPLIDRASALINDTASDTDWMLAIDHPTAQDEVDRLFD